MLSLLRCGSGGSARRSPAAQFVCKVFPGAGMRSGVRRFQYGCAAVLAVTTVVYKKLLRTKLTRDRENPEKLI
jgi:hypothetical protein